MAKIIAALLLLTVTGHAAERRTLKDLVQLVMEKGEAGTLGAYAAKAVAIEPMATKDLWFDQGVTPDGNEHVFTVLLEKEKPVGIILTSSRLTEAPEKRMEGFKHHITLSAVAKTIVHYSGTTGNITHVRLTGKAAKARLKDELSFWVNESSKYEWSK